MNPDTAICRWESSEQVGHALRVKGSSFTLITAGTGNHLHFLPSVLISTVCMYVHYLDSMSECVAVFFGGYIFNNFRLLIK